jgi:uncharacterized membrane protein YdjX (TVP38/TMEM64 family)
MPPLARPVLFAIAVAALLLLLWLVPIGEWLTAFLGWIDANRTISWLVFILAYAAFVVLLVPGSLMTLGAGFLFGLPFGFAVVSAASTLGAALAFLVGRYFLRGWVEQRLDNVPRFAALDRAIGERGWLIVLLTRLSPVFPFNLLNYALGLTGVRFTSYVVASWIGMMPGTLLYVYLGSVGQDLASLLAGDLPSSDATGWLFYGGLVATVVLTVMVTRIATRALNAQLETGQTDGSVVR